MSSPIDFERRISDWLNDQAPMREPDALTNAVLARTRRTRRMPGWLGLERWYPMGVTTRRSLVPPMRAAWLLIILLLAALLAVGVAVVGSRLLLPPPPVRLIPRGDAAIVAFAVYTSDAQHSAGDLYLARADGSDVRPVTSGQDFDSSPTWSPDGTRIAFHRWAGGKDVLMVADAGGGNAAALASNPATAQDCIGRWAAAWSPNGKSLVFTTRQNCSGGFDLNIVPADGSAPATKLLADGTYSMYGSWSPDGKRIAFLGSQATGSSGLYVANTDADGGSAGGLHATQLVSNVAFNLTTFSDPPQELDQPRWSPGGTELAVTSVARGDFLEQSDGILIVKADGSGQRLIAPHGGNPAWSPDGTQLVFQRTAAPAEWVNSRPCTEHTFVINADGTNERQLPELGDGCGGAAPLWSPDGTRIATILITPQGAGVDPLFRMGVVMVDGSHAPVILGDAYGDWQPVVAPIPAAASATP